MKKTKSRYFDSLTDLSQKDAQTLLRLHKEGIISQVTIHIMTDRAHNHRELELNATEIKRVKHVNFNYRTYITL